MKANQQQSSIIKRLILHFNIDKTIVMRDSFEYNNPDYTLRDIFTQLIWGKPEVKGAETIFKLGHPELEFDRNNLPDPELISYKEFLDEQYKLRTTEEEPEEEARNTYNNEIIARKMKVICDLTEKNNPGNKFIKAFEDMRKKLKVDEKIQSEYGLKQEAKLDFKTILQPKDENDKFSELEDDRKVKFRYIFKNSYHKIILPFFAMMNSLKKAKREYSIIFRFFGHEDEDIEEFVYEFNNFCDGFHPRFCGNHNFPLIKFDGILKGTKDYKIHSDKMDNIAVSFRNKNPNNESMVFETIDRPEKGDDVDEMRDNIEEFYDDDNKSSGVKISKGYNAIYLTLMEKLSQHCSFVIIDDYQYFQKNSAHGKMMLVDPYDYETLQIFFDVDLHKYPYKIDVVDVANKNILDYNYCVNKFLVNVEPRKAITDPNYFYNKIEICENNRLTEIKNIGVKEMPLYPIPVDFNLEKEVSKLSSDKYLEMTLFPLLHSVRFLILFIRH
jgi:hypothetical protein